MYSSLQLTEKLRESFINSRSSTKLQESMEQQPLLSSPTMQAKHKLGYLVPIFLTVAALIVTFVFNGLAGAGPNGEKLRFTDNAM